MLNVTRQTITKLGQKLPIKYDDLHFEIFNIYEWYDGPLLYSVKTRSGDYYLVTKCIDYHKIDNNIEINYNAIFPITVQELKLIESNKLSLKQLYQSSNAKQYFIEEEKIDYNNSDSITTYYTFYLLNVMNNRPNWAKM